MHSSSENEHELIPKFDVFDVSQGEVPFLF